MHTQQLEHDAFGTSQMCTSRLHAAQSHLRGADQGAQVANQSSRQTFCAAPNVRSAMNENTLTPRWTGAHGAVERALRRDAVGHDEDLEAKLAQVEHSLQAADVRLHLPTRGHEEDA